MYESQSKEMSIRQNIQCYRKNPSHSVGGEKAWVLISVKTFFANNNFRFFSTVTCKKYENNSRIFVNFLNPSPNKKRLPNLNRR